MARTPSARVLKSLLLLLFAVALAVPGDLVAAQRGHDVSNLPPIEVDALSEFRWSDHTIVATPGQRLIITNRDVERHTFTIDEWGVDEPLPTLQSVDIFVPDDAEIGSVVQFFSSVGDDRAEGLEGIIQIVSADELLAGEDRDVPVAGTIQSRAAIEIRDDFTFTPSRLDVEPGAFIEIRNTGVIEHHFVVDEWDVNQTISAGDLAIVQVPENAEAGVTFTFYCSVPGHHAQGMTGTVTIVPARASVQTISPDSAGRVEVGKDLSPFVPDATFLGPEWSRLRMGDATTLLQREESMSQDIFPYDGLGAVYVGPQGSRVTLIVLPLTDRALPANQVKDAIGSVQDSMMETWNKDRIGSLAYTDAAPPAGCDVAQRASGIVPVLTIPAGATACQLRSAGVAIFVTVEGAVGDQSGVAAADEVVSLLLTRSPQAILRDGSRRG